MKLIAHSQMQQQLVRMQEMQRSITAFLVHISRSFFLILDFPFFCSR